MREIKFRAWNKQARKMFNIQKALFGAHGGSCFRVEGIWFPETKPRVANREELLNNPTIMPEIATMNVCDDTCGEKTAHCVLMQYTGLKDKNGKEIYEGDIMVVNGENGEVYYDDNNVCFEVDVDCDHNPCIGRYEVIGNVFENPDLLTDK